MIDEILKANFSLVLTGTLIIGIIIGILIMKLCKAFWYIFQVSEVSSVALVRAKDIERYYSTMTQKIYEADSKVKDLDQHLHFIKQIKATIERQEALEQKFNSLQAELRYLKAHQGE